MNRNLLFLLFFTSCLLYSCNKSPELFAGIYLGMPEDNFYKIVDRKDRVLENIHSSQYKYLYKMSKYEYLFDPIYKNDKVAKIKGVFYYNWAAIGESPNNNILMEIPNGKDRSDNLNEIISILCKKYGNYKLETIEPSNPFDQRLNICRWKKHSFTIELIYQYYENTTLIYELNKEVIDKLEKDEKRQKDIL